MPSICTTTIHCRAQDVPQFLRALIDPPATYKELLQPDHSIQLTFDSFRYESLDQFPTSVPCYGWTSSGDAIEETPREFFCDGHHPIAITERSPNGGYPIDIDEATGKPDPADLTHFKEFFTQRMAVKNLIHNPVHVESL